MANERPSTAPRRGMGRGPARGIAEKPKNFKKALKNAVVYLKPFLPSIIIAIILAIASAVFSIIGPNQISDLSNAIQSGVPTTFNPNPNPINFNTITQCSYIVNYLCKQCNFCINTRINYGNNIQPVCQKFTHRYFSKN